MLEERRNPHYLRRSGNLAVRRNRWRRGLLRRTLSLSLRLGVAAGVYLAGRQAYLAAITSSRFDVKTIAIRGNTHARTADLLALCGSVLSQNIFRVDLEKLRAEILRSPWILEASIRCSLPDTIEVSVVEREPAAIASFEGRSYLVDATGRMLAEYGPEVGAYDFPVLTGFDTLSRQEAVRRIRAGAEAVASLASASPDFTKRISEIDLSSGDRLALHPADGSPVLYLDPQDPLRNLAHYIAIRSLVPRSLSTAEGADPPRIDYVDLRFQDRIAVMPRASGRSGDE